MAEDLGKRDPSLENQTAAGAPAERSWRLKGSKISIFPCFVYFSVTALLILATALFFQMQLIALEKEVAALKAKFSDPNVVQEEGARSLRKRSSAEIEEDVAARGSGIEAIHLQGSLPLQQVQKQGKIGPWSSSAEVSFASLKDRNTEIKINRKGTYFVYAQVYYLTSNPHNSFQILSHNGTEERRAHSILATCASQGRSSVGEVSCYAGFTSTFEPGQRLYLNQIEQNRIIYFNNGCTYFGVVLLRTHR